MTQADDLERFNEGMELLRSGQLDRAIECFRYAASTGKDRPMEHYALAVALYRHNDYQAARKEFEKFLAMSPKENRYVRQAKSILPILEDKLAAQDADSPPQDAQSAGEEPASSAHGPAQDAAAARYDEGIQAYLRGDLDEAADAFLDLLDERPDSRDLHNALGLTWLARKDYEKAVQCFQCAIELDPEFLEAINNLGLAWCDYGLEKAREAFEKALDRDPEFFDALVNLASLKYRMGEIAESRDLWQRAADLKPDDPQVVRNLEVFR